MTFVGEEAVDSGGPRREFFRILGMEGARRLFVGNDTKKFFASRVTAIQVHVMLLLLFRYMSCMCLGCVI